MTRRWLVIGAIVPGFACGPAAAFTFADGTTAECVARGEVVAEVFTTGDDPAIRNRTGLASRVGRPLADHLERAAAQVAASGSPRFHLLP